MLRGLSSKRFGRVYNGSFRLKTRPPGNQLLLTAFAPKDTRLLQPPESGVVDALLTQSFNFVVQP
jgi:hypothetical protein